MALSSRVEIHDCEITVIHRLHLLNQGCSEERFREVVREIRESLERVWGGPFAFGLFCTVRFRFEFVENLEDADESVDIKLLRCESGICNQKGLGPERTIGTWYVGDPTWDGGVAAHEVGHELGMEDKYECTDDEGNLVPCYLEDEHGVLYPNPDAHWRPAGSYPRDGLAFSCRGRPQPVDIAEIMAALGVECPCGEIELPDGPIGGTPDGGSTPGEGGGEDGGPGSAPEPSACILELRFGGTLTQGPHIGTLEVQIHLSAEGQDRYLLHEFALGRRGELDSPPILLHMDPLRIPRKCQRRIRGTLNMLLTLKDADGRERSNALLSDILDWEVSCPGVTRVRTPRMDFVRSWARAVPFVEITAECEGASGTRPRPTETEARRSIFWDRNHFLPEPSEDPYPPSTPDPHPQGNREPRPLVFVPGFMGSSLAVSDARGRSRTVWPPPKLNMTLRPLYPGDPELHPTGLFPEVYDPLIAFITRDRDLGGMGHVLNRTFWPFAYDWTESNWTTGARLHAFILQKLALVNARRRRQGLPPWDSVDVINHSNGGLVTRSAVVVHGAPVHKTVYLASPHWGAPDAFFALRVGLPYFFDRGSLWENAKMLAGWFVLHRRGQSANIHTEMKRLAGALPTPYELSPDAFYLRDDHMIFTTNPAEAIRTVRRSYFEGGWALEGNARQLMLQGQTFKGRLGALPPGEHLVLYGDDSATLDVVEWRPAGLIRSARFLAPRARSNNNGDRTVPTRSAEVSAGRAQEVDGDHGEIPNNGLVHRLIRRYLPGD